MANPGQSMARPEAPSPARRVIMAAIAQGRTLAAAESLTAGLVCAWLADVPGASGALQGGVVAYQNGVKSALLGVDGKLLSRDGAVQPEVARQMAEGVRRAVGADIGVSTTGAAGPEAHGGRPVGTVFVGIAWTDGSRVHEFHFEGTREQIRTQAAEAAIQALDETLGLAGARAREQNT